MDMDDLTPSDGGSLRAALRPATAEPVATFTPTGVTHPDAIWSPRGSELAPPPRPPFTAGDYRAEAPAERPTARETMGDDSHFSVT
jgi:hypothetical protein